jgi:hypothetical protein
MFCGGLIQPENGFKWDGIYKMNRIGEKAWERAVFFSIP